MIEQDSAGLSVSRQCALIDLPRSSYYREPAAESDENLVLMQMIDEEYMRHPFYGSRQMRNWLNRQPGIRVNRKRVQRLMQMMGLRSIAPQKRTSVPNMKHKVYPYLIRGMNIDRPNRVWCSDITYIRLKGGFVYLTVEMDWFSRYVLSWEVSVTMEDSFCVSALERAIRRHGKPELHNTDQGAQYTGAAYTGVLQSEGVRISMDGKGRAMDNIMVERLWRTLKYEDIYIKDYESVDALVKGLREYFEFYNNERTHSSLGGMTPAEVHFGREALEMAA
jgi:putative transposase